MLVATFGPTTEWVGKTITFENGQFVLEGHGPITAQDTMTYDREGHLQWAYDGLRAWVGGIAGGAPSQSSGAAATAVLGAGQPGDAEQSSGVPGLHWYFDVLKKYAVFKGRATRREYWMFQLFNAIVFFALLFLDAALGTLDVSEDGAAGVISSLYILAVLLPMLAVTVRRLHDTEHSGWWVLIAWIPIGSLFLLYWTVLDGDPWTNDFGANPKRLSLPAKPTRDEATVAARASSGASGDMRSGHGRGAPAKTVPMPSAQPQCPACNAGLLPGAKFCGECGAPNVPGAAGP